ncbi:hypothetical protein E2C01_061189 [Portunus trituberculatus]|uniref:Uncharacterized protein n=1 Tax=Portunus trituberculatus TaxID=210409 RepID=A0A5B7HB06_PORTR|nr:hypothetical protein [Portunus trituberculatus]
MYERRYDGSLGGDLLFRARAQYMDVNAKNYRWSESRSKVCQMCDMGGVRDSEACHAGELPIQRFGSGAIPSVLLYADVVVMSESAFELQSMLDVVDGYGRDFGVRFSSEKK